MFIELPIYLWGQMYYFFVTKNITKKQKNADRSPRAEIKKVSDEVYV